MPGQPDRPAHSGGHQRQRPHPVLDHRPAGARRCGHRPDRRGVLAAGHLRRDRPRAARPARRRRDHPARRRAGSSRRRTTSPRAPPRSSSRWPRAWSRWTPRAGSRSPTAAPSAMLGFTWDGASGRTDGRHELDLPLGGRQPADRRRPSPRPWLCAPVVADPRRDRRPCATRRWRDLVAAGQLGAAASSDGTVLGVVSSFIDITTRREQEEARRVRDARLRAAQALTGLAWWELDPRTGRHEWSDEMFRLLGLEPSGQPLATRSSSRWSTPTTGRRRSRCGSRGSAPGTARCSGWCCRTARRGTCRPGPTSSRTPRVPW